ncbi:hypothetical protein I79_018224 [Cricetulus griseus]|uniref:Uncharacterized protein n=1 Tax=Cricetulus griseus TaxID=10029 RepID=G3I450_CRIGR|nr:hypothetical protein I79_018224 [Cricetulus griseus]
MNDDILVLTCACVSRFLHSHVCVCPDPCTSTGVFTFLGHPQGPVPLFLNAITDGSTLNLTFLDEHSLYFKQLCN